MACLQNGTTLLNNNSLSSFKHSIMKYDETHPNMWSNTSQINNFLNKNCQIPFRNNHAKDKPQSDNVLIKEEIHSCLQDDVTRQMTDNETNETTVNNSIISQNDQLLETPKLSTAHDKNDQTKQFLFFKTEDDSDIYTNQNESPSEHFATTNSESETGEPSHHARRPMNAFLIFCKRHRTVVKNRYPHLENRAVTKILGEWWAALETEEKSCYTELAKQYKNAFFSANPNFKWYKLPAPPLRTLHTRPSNVVKSPPPPKQAPTFEAEEKPQQLFTPGKLADETQLGSITSLINCDNSGAIKTATSIGKNVSDTPKSNEQTVLSSSECDYKNYLLSPPGSSVKLCQPPKPFKKRMLHSPKDNKNIVRSIFCTNESDIKQERNIFDSASLDQALEQFVDTVKNESSAEGFFEDNTKQKPFNNSNFTQQEIINKVVDHMCSTKTESNDSNNDDFEDSDCNSQDSKSKETRKSVRSCKGLRYAKFMAEGKLFVNKRNKKHYAASKLPKPSFTSSTASDKVPRNSESIELNETIKKLAERTVGNFSKIPKTELECVDQIEQDTAPETRMFRAADFNLDEKIEALPSLSLEKFQQKKKENKKRKFIRAAKFKESAELKKQSSEDNFLTGSRKRKPRKQSITRLELEQSNSHVESSAELDLFGLATLAEVAAKKAKIDQK